MHISGNIFDVRSFKLCLIVTKTILPCRHVDGKFEISQKCLKLIISQKRFFHISKPYSAVGNMVSQLDTPTSVLSCRKCFDFLDILVLRCSIVWLYIIFFIFEFLFNLFDLKCFNGIFHVLPCDKT